MPRSFIYFWIDGPGGNVEHVADHDVSQDEFEQAVARSFGDRSPSRTRRDRWAVTGYTDAARLLTIVFDLDALPELGAWGVMPVTAYDPESMPRKR